MPDKVKDVIDYWLDALEKDHPGFLEQDDGSNKARTADVMQEYWHVYFDPITHATELQTECGKVEYNNPEFVEKARLIAQQFYSKHFNYLLTEVEQMIKQANEKDIQPELILVPWWLMKVTYKRGKERFDHIYGIPVGEIDKNKIRIEAPTFNFLAETLYDHSHSCIF